MKNVNIKHGSENIVIWNVMQTCIAFIWLFKVCKLVLTSFFSRWISVNLLSIFAIFLNEKVVLDMVRNHFLRAYNMRFLIILLKTAEASKFY